MKENTITLLVIIFACCFITISILTGNLLTTREKCMSLCLDNNGTFINYVNDSCICEETIDRFTEERKTFSLKLVDSNISFGFKSNLLTVWNCDKIICENMILNNVTFSGDPVAWRLKNCMTKNCVINGSVE